MGDPFAEVLGPLRTLRDRAGEVLARHGLKIQHFAVAPGSSLEGPHGVHLVATLTGDGPSARDEEFDRVLREARDADVDRRSRETLDELRQRLRGSTGFLDPVPPEDE